MSTRNSRCDVQAQSHVACGPAAVLRLFSSHERLENSLEQPQRDRFAVVVDAQDDALDIILRLYRD